MDTTDEYKRVVHEGNREVTEKFEDDKRPVFGNRILDDPSKVFEHNAWDNVHWNETMEEEGRKKIAANSKELVPELMQLKYENECHVFWDDFYKIHQNRFFKDRHWLFTEFPELGNLDMGNSRNAHTGEKCLSIEYPGCRSVNRILEVGCGVGNTVFPILQTNNSEYLFIYGCDISKTAIDLLQKHQDYESHRCHAFVCDVTNENSKYPFPAESLDVIILIFVLSAIHPNKFRMTVHNLCKYLKPGGVILFRDYGRYDLAQLRFKNGHCLQDNFYVRGDGTRVYFFSQEELDKLFCAEKLTKEQNYVDRRLQVNRSRQLQMYRVWIQCKYRKPVQQ